MAALSIAEALILLLVEKGVLKSVDIIEALESCVESHRIGSAEASSESEQARQTEAARLIEHLMLGRNLDATARRS